MQSLEEQFSDEDIVQIVYHKFQFNGDDKNPHLALVYEEPLQGVDIAIAMEPLSAKVR